MIVLGLISSYREGSLVQHAIRTALQAADHVLVMEGPAGPPLTADVPATEPGEYAGHPRVTIRSGRWRTDARKRTAMLEWAHTHTGPTWGLWLDSDEVLVNGEYLRDWLQLLAWQERPGEEPNARCPLRLIELDGSISVSLAKCVRTDLIRDYTVSIAELTARDGTIGRAGNFHDTIERYFALAPDRVRKLQDGYLYWPPGPAPLDPYIVHRSILRHPLRAGLRLNEQEADEIAKRKE